MQAVTKIITWINDNITWGIPMLVLMIGTGIFLSIRLKFLQFTKVRHILRCTVGRMFYRKGDSHGAVSPFQAMCTALAATIGTGSIAGVAGAIALGGPGAVFWMWISALVGMITKFCEVTLAVHFRERNAKGDWVGGPMYYIKNGLGKNWQFLAVLFSLFGAFAAFGIGNIVQSNQITVSILQTCKSFGVADENILRYIGYGVAAVITIITALVLMGGIKRIGSVTERLVPIMSILYILVMLVVVLANLRVIGKVFESIFVGAFTPRAFTGGVAGITIFSAMKNGVGRGVFSNEAGLGSAPIAHAASNTDSPVKQGFFGVVEVFFVTIVICTMTALTILSPSFSHPELFSIPWGTAADAQLTMQAASTVFDSRIAALLISVALALFALSTILSWGLYGVRCMEYLLGSKSIIPYKIVFCLLLPVGAIVQNSAFVWGLANLLNSLMAIPNLIALLLLSGVVVRLVKNYFIFQNSIRMLKGKEPRKRANLRFYDG